MDMAPSSTDRLSASLDSLAARFNAAKEAPAHVENALTLAKHVLQGTDPVSPAKARALKKSYTAALNACGIELEQVADSTALAEAMTKLTETLEQRHGELMGHVAGVFQLLQDAAPVIETASQTITEDKTDLRTRPDINKNLPSLEEINREESAADLYMKASTSARWLKWIKTPTKEQQVNFHFRRAQARQFENQQLNIKLMDAMHILSPEERQEFMKKKIYNEAAKIDHLLQDFYFARLAVYDKESITDSLVAECETRFPHLRLGPMSPTIHFFEQDGRYTDSELRRLSLERSISEQCTHLSEEIEASIVNLAAFRGLATRLKEKDVVIAVDNLKTDRTTAWDNLRSKDTEISLISTNLNDLRDRLRLEEVLN